MTDRRAVARVESGPASEPDYARGERWGDDVIAICQGCRREVQTTRAIAYRNLLCSDCTMKRYRGEPLPVEGSAS